MKYSPTSKGMRHLSEGNGMCNNARAKWEKTINDEGVHLVKTCILSFLHFLETKKSTLVSLPLIELNSAYNWESAKARK